MLVEVLGLIDCILLSCIILVFKICVLCMFSYGFFVLRYEIFWKLTLFHIVKGFIVKEFLVPKNLSWPLSGDDSSLLVGLLLLEQVHTAITGYILLNPGTSMNVEFYETGYYYWNIIYFKTAIAIYILYYSLNVKWATKLLCSYFEEQREYILYILLYLMDYGRCRRPS